MAHPGADRRHHPAPVSYTHLEGEEFQLFGVQEGEDVTPAAFVKRLGLWVQDLSLIHIFIWNPIII